MQNKVERPEEHASPPPIAGVTRARREVRELGVAPRERLEYIDGLRACAALAVVIDHTALMVPGWRYINAGQHVPLEWLRHILVDGAHGVDLFFVLSGFCLAYPTLARFHATGSRAFNLQRFAVHRIVRILPPYYIATALLLCGACIAFVRTGRFNTPNSPPLHVADILGQFLMLDRGISLASSPYWTLLVEFRWYFLFPAVFFVFMRARNGFLSIIFLCYIAYFFTRMHNLDFGLLPAFMLGILAANLMVTESPLCRYALPLCAVAVAAALLFEPYTTMPNNFDYEEQKFFWQTNPGWHFAAFFFVVAAGQVKWLRALLSVRWLTFLGVASYSIYLVHYAVVVYIGTRLMEKNIFLGYGLTVVAAVGVGIAFYFAVEQWFCGGVVREMLYAWLTPRVRVVADWLATSGSDVAATRQAPEGRA